MRIAICDSNAKELKELKISLYTYCNLRKMDYIIEEFLSGEELLISKNEYCLIFTEYKLTGIDGLETVKKLRKRGCKSKVIFLSHNTDFIFESFKVSPYRFLTKPLSEKALFTSLDEFFYSKTENRPLLITDKLNTHYLNTSEIIYLEASDKHCFIHLENKVIECNKTMAKVVDTLPDRYFIKINRAFVINLNYISKYNNEFVSLSDNTELHISRNYLKYFKQEFINFTKPRIP